MKFHIDIEEIQLLPKFLINSGKQENFIQSAVRKEEDVDVEEDVVDVVLLPVVPLPVLVLLVLLESNI